jgi:hypothetical protein
LSRLSTEVGLVDFPKAFKRLFHLDILYHCADEPEYPPSCRVGNPSTTDSLKFPCCGSG